VTHTLNQATIDEDPLLTTPVFLFEMLNLIQSRSGPSTPNFRRQVPQAVTNALLVATQTLLEQVLAVLAVQARTRQVLVRHLAGLAKWGNTKQVSLPP
jgi:hypothetical protein